MKLCLARQGLYRLCYASGTSTPEIGKERIRVYTDGSRRDWPWQINPNKQPLSRGSVQGSSDSGCFRFVDLHDIHFLFNFLKELKRYNQVVLVSERVEKTTTIEKKTMDIEERGVRLRLTIVDTPGALTRYNYDTNNYYYNIELVYVRQVSMSLENVASSSRISDFTNSYVTFQYVRIDNIIVARRNYIPTFFIVSGFGDAVNCEDTWKACSAYIDEQFRQYFTDESGLNRKNIQDNRVHCCLYFIPPYGHG